MSAGGRVRAVVGVLGELLITAGLVLVLFALYTLFWTGIETAGAQDELEQEFAALDRPRPAANPPADEDVDDALPGDAYARMRIPRLGEDWEWIVVQGVDVLDLRRGPGHYLDTADPGEIGNFAVAGHRATYGEPFAYLDQVQIGDEILVDYRTGQYRYVVTETFLTTPYDGDVLAPVPSQPEAEPTEAVITLTTCHPRFSGAQRLIVQGLLADEEA
jgi:sortase A